MMLFSPLLVPGAFISAVTILPVPAIPMLLKNRILVFVTGFPLFSLVVLVYWLECGF